MVGFIAVSEVTACCWVARRGEVGATLGVSSPVAGREEQQPWSEIRDDAYEKW